MRLRGIAALLAVLMLVSSAVCATESPTEFNLYVAPNGDDEAKGTIDAPLRTVAAAKERAAGLDKSKYSAINVVFREGFYEIESSINFSGTDSGTETCRVTYKPYPGEKVSWTGTKKLDASGFEPVTDEKVLARVPEDGRAKLMQLDMAAIGLADISKVERTYYFVDSEPACDIIWDGEFCTIARWPNDEYATVGAILYPGIKSREGFGGREVPVNPNDKGVVFRTDAPRVEMWKEAKDAWLIGYWMYNWAMDSLRITNISGNMIATDMSPSYGTRKGGQYYIYNLLEEIDAPGEWYIDNDSDMLYIYPPSEITPESSIEITYLPEDMIKMDGASYITFENLTLEGGKYGAANIDNGQYIEFKGCTIKNFVKEAVYMGLNVSHSGLLSCDVHSLGASGINLNCGNRSNLIPMGNYVVNCDIHNFGRIEKVYKPGISVGGVGNYIAYNKIHDAPHAAILFSGNDIIVEYNEIFDVVNEGSDAGAFYACRDYLHNGFILRYNYFHDITGAGQIGHAVGVYMDDMLGSMTIYGNVINRVNLGIICGGGKNNTIANNIVMNGVGRDPYWFWGDDRALPGHWAVNALSEVTRNQGLVDYKSAAWQEKYPGMEKLFEEDFGWPVGNRVYDNVVYNHGETYLEGVFAEYSYVGENYFADKPLGFVDEESGDLRLREDSPVYKNLPDFKYIPFERIGLYEDEYRASDGALKEK